MSSQAQTAANRLNAQKSTGPQTPEGKAAVAQNALKHGLSATRNVIFTESQQDYDLHQAALLEELTPQGPMEAILADRIVSLSWRLKRAEEMQNQTIDAINDKNKCLAFLDTLMPGEKPRDPALALGRIVYKDFVNYRTLDRLLMYERRIENSLYKTTRQLKILQKQRKTNQTAHPSPVIARSAATRQSPTSRIITNIEHQESCIEHPQSDIRIPQNKPNSKNEKTNLTSLTVTNYNQNPPQENTKKQTQYSSPCQAVQAKPSREDGSITAKPIGEAVSPRGKILRRPSSALCRPSPIPMPNYAEQTQLVAAKPIGEAGFRLS